MPSPSTDDPVPVGNGAIVELEYELWAEGAGRVELVDTTREEVAQSAEVKTPEGHTFGPRAHVIGSDYFPAAIESFLATLPVGEEKEQEFAPADAFGEKDPKLIELFSMHEIERLPEMRKNDAELDIGTILTIRGRRGRVVSLTAARVRVDFNPAYAGRKVKGKFKVLALVTEPADKVRAIIELGYGRGKEFGVEIQQNRIRLKVPDRSKFDVAWLAAKPRLVEQLRTHLKPTSIEVIEEYVTPAKERAAEKAKSGEKGKHETAVEPAKTRGDSKASPETESAAPESTSEA
ncbi:MAG: hypothetical protein WCA77_05385 [Thermoplasmata archaeon]